ncbi:peptidase, partial [Burkholderia sp. Ax-1735]|nr:peptidase [Burkholderia sp. Ax-1735]
MKLRRTMALAAATAVITPAVLLSASAASAEPKTTTTEAETTAPNPSASPSDAETPPTETVSPSPDTAASETPGDTEETEEAEKPGGGGETGEDGPTPSATPSASAPTSPKPSATPSADTDPEDEEPLACEPRPLELSIKGLAGKIVRGSGWHKFPLNVYNDTKTTVNNVLFFAGASTDKHGDDLFTTKQVELQALNEGTWEDVSEEGLTAGIVGATDVIKPGYEVDIPLRVKVKKSAPVGAGFSLGGGLVFGEDVVSAP